MREWEEETLREFLVYVATNLRDSKRARNTAGYAQQVVSTVRADAERGSCRKVGVVGDFSRCSARTTAINKTLRRDGPVMKPPRRPVLIHHRAKVAESKNLTGDSVDAKVNRAALALASS